MKGFSHFWTRNIKVNSYMGQQSVPELFLGFLILNILFYLYAPQNTLQAPSAAVSLKVFNARLINAQFKCSNKHVLLCQHIEISRKC